MKKTKRSKFTDRLKRSPPHHIDTGDKPLPYPQRPRSKKNTLIKPIKRS